MSPEQAAGQPLDARSDVFSFGIVLYELLAGRRPFDGANDLELLKSIAHATPAPLPERRAGARCATSVDKALEKDPADRYQTMRDLVVGSAARDAQDGSADCASRQSRSGGAGASRGSSARLRSGSRSAPSPRSARCAGDSRRHRRSRSGCNSRSPAPGYQIERARDLARRDTDRVRKRRERHAGRSGCGRSTRSRRAHCPARRARAPRSGRRIAAISRSPRTAQLKKLDVNGGPAQTIADLPPNSQQWHVERERRNPLQRDGDDVRPRGHERRGQAVVACAAQSRRRAARAAGEAARRRSLLICEPRAAARQERTNAVRRLARRPASLLGSRISRWATTWCRIA